jgi:hypothetical protein
MPNYGTDTRQRSCSLYFSSADLVLANIPYLHRRHQSPIIPVRVGPHAETFYVHRAVLSKSEYFRKALDGDFWEAENQAIDLPEEDTAIFSFVVAFLYEGTYTPIRPVADALGLSQALSLLVV